MLISVIIVSHNTVRLTRRCIDTVRAAIDHSSRLDDSRAEVIVVDNASSDGSVELLRQLPVKLIENQINTGFAAANNQGIAQAKGKLVMLLNSDTELDQTALDKLIATFERHAVDETTAHLKSAGNAIDRLGIVAARLVNPDGSYQPQGGCEPSLVSLAVQMLLLDDLPVLGKWLPSTQHTGRNWQDRPTSSGSDIHPRLEAKDWVAATAMMVRRSVFDEIGALDNNMFMYGEDIEFCLRARHHHWDIAIDHSARVLHHGSASSSSQQAVIGELTAYRYIWAKHKPWWQLPLVAALLKTGALLRIGLFGILGRRQAAWYRRALAQL
ncbi:MAG: hypothetical protein COU69_01720 [Candidatus Pacebacteria bacterium CG10_big_fil_rev_8_21_14_0_10_56_10]|nr:MAG: hypothetical protein COU69_01720 [Candidatus Pacebacteria bacterium CG10_big_fil_rev_8_21_14_0_10_56_10]